LQVHGIQCIGDTKPSIGIQVQHDETKSSSKNPSTGVFDSGSIEIDFDFRKPLFYLTIHKISLAQNEIESFAEILGTLPDDISKEVVKR